MQTQENCTCRAIRRRQSFLRQPKRRGDRMSAFAGYAFTPTGVILVLFILLVIVSRAWWI
jgi:hypothetical protein